MMRFCTARRALALLAVLCVACAAADAPAHARRRALPNPMIYLQRTETVQSGGKEFIRYHLGVDNAAAYPDEMFASSPQLPPCGQNTKSARTWVDIYAQDGKLLNKFCALGKAADLNSIWFALESDVVPPSWVYVELNDRGTNTKYKSGLTDTSL